MVPSSKSRRTRAFSFPLHLLHLSNLVSHHVAVLKISLLLLMSNKPFDISMPIFLDADEEVRYRAEVLSNTIPQHQQEQTYKLLQPLIESNVSEVYEETTENSCTAAKISSRGRCRLQAEACVLVLRRHSSQHLRQPSLCLKIRKIYLRRAITLTTCLC
jgi:hypothetical protein